MVNCFYIILVGPWLFHCHNELHVEQGMLLVIEVGEPKTWPQNPTPYYCGAKMPAVRANPTAADPKAADPKDTSAACFNNPSTNILIWTTTMAAFFYLSKKA